MTLKDLMASTAHYSNVTLIKDLPCGQRDQKQAIEISVTQSHCRSGKMTEGSGSSIMA